MIFPIQELLDEQACHDYLMGVLHPNGLSCPQGPGLPPGQAPHDRHRAPIYDYRCRECGAVYNLFSGTVFTGSHYSCSVIVLILRGIVQGVPTQTLAQELGIDRGNLLERRHQIQAFLEQLSPPSSPAHG
jgi:transposase-like protein